MCQRDDVNRFEMYKSVVVNFRVERSFATPLILYSSYHRFNNTNETAAVPQMPPD